MSFYFVNPLDTAEILGTDGPATEGNAYLVTTPRTIAVHPWDGREWAVLEAKPGSDFYTYVAPSNPAPGAYYISAGVTFAFSGQVQQAGAFVQGTRVWTRISIDNLLETKKAELEEWVDEVYFSAFKMTGAGATDFWVNASLRSRLFRQSVNGYYQWQPPDGSDMRLETSPSGERVIGDGVRPWRDIPQWIVRVDNSKEIRTKLDEDDWANKLWEAQGRFDIDTAYATDDTSSNLEALHNADDWDGLAAYDVRSDPNPTNPWPESGAAAGGVFNGAAF